MALSVEVKSIHSPDLNREALPVEPDNCAVLIEAEIGEKGKRRKGSLFVYRRNAKVSF